MPSYSDFPVVLFKVQRRRLLVFTLAACAVAVLFLFALGNVRGMVAHRVDDYTMDQQAHSKDFAFFGTGMSLPARYLDLARGRLFLSKAYGRVLDITGGNFDRAYLLMMGVYFVTGLMMLRFAQPICGLAGSAALAAFFLTFWQKSEALIDFSGTMYIVVIGIFIACLQLERSRLPIIKRYVFITLLLWLAIHLYEILIFAPFVLAGIMAGRLWLDERRWPRRTELIALSLPFLMTAIHVGILASKPNWYTRNPTEFAEQSKVELISKAFANSLNLEFGREAAEQWKGYWGAFWDATFPANPLAILAVPLFLLLVLIAVRIDAEPAPPSDDQPAVAPPGRGYLWGLVVTGTALIIFAPLLHISLGVDHGCPGRFLYLPSVGFCMVCAAGLALLRSREVRIAVTCVLFFLACAQALAMRSFFHMNADASDWDDRQTAMISTFGWKNLAGGKILALFPTNCTADRTALWRRSCSLYEQGSAAFYFWEMQKLRSNAVAYEPVKDEKLTLGQLDRLAERVAEWRLTPHAGPLGIIYFDAEARAWGLREIRWIGLDGQVLRTLTCDAFEPGASASVKILECTVGTVPKFRLLDSPPAPVLSGL